MENEERNQILIQINDILYNLESRLSEPSRIEEDLFLGGRRSAHDVEKLSSLGITHVLNCAGKDLGIDQSFYGNEFILKSIEAEDSEDFPIIPKFFEESKEFLIDAHEKKGKVLIACGAGVNRSATICVAYHMWRRQIKVTKAIEEVFQNRKMILSNEGFRGLLVDLAFTFGLI